MTTLAEIREACDAIGESARDPFSFQGGYAAAHRKLGAAVGGVDVVAEFTAHIERLRDAATDSARREWLHRLLGNVRKV